MRPETGNVSPVSRHTRGSTLSFTVIPRSNRLSIEEATDGALHVRITTPPVEGAANAAVLRFLADILNVPCSHLEIVTGEKSRRKRVVVGGLPPAELEHRLRDALGKRH